MWEGNISEDGKTFYERNGTGSREVVEFSPSTERRPGILVTYRAGTKGWSGRGEQSYYPARYTVHVVEECAPTSGAGYWVRFSGRRDLHTNLKKQREKRTKQRNRQLDANTG